MTKWWWRFIPGRRRKTRKLEKRRVEVLSSITGDRLRVELMAQRPRLENDPLTLEEALTTYQRGTYLLNYCQNRLTEAEQRIQVLEGEKLQDYRIS